MPILGAHADQLAPCSDIQILTTNSSTVLSPPSRAIQVGAAGSLQVELANATQSVTLTVLAGDFLWLKCKVVHACPANTYALW